MLFSDRSETATNTLNFGSGLRGVLHEADATSSPYIDSDIVVDGTVVPAGAEPGSGARVSGIDYGNLVPNQVITKIPTVRRSDANAATASDAYVAVKVTLTADPSNLTGDNERNKKLYDALWNAVVGNDSSVNTTDWAVLKTADATEYTAWFFYVNSDSTLKALPPLTDSTASVTPALFETIRIPDFAAQELDDFAAYTGTLTLTLQPYLIQSANNPYNERTDKTTLADYLSAFSVAAPAP
jgi:hypothetical protein